MQGKNNAQENIRILLLVNSDATRLYLKFSFFFIILRSCFFFLIRMERDCTYIFYFLFKINNHILFEWSWKRDWFLLEEVRGYALLKGYDTFRGVSYLKVCHLEVCHGGVHSIGGVSWCIAFWMISISMHSLMHMYINMHIFSISDTEWHWYLLHSRTIEKIIQFHKVIWSL